MEVRTNAHGWFMKKGPDRFLTWPLQEALATVVCERNHFLLKNHHNSKGVFLLHLLLLCFILLPAGKAGAQSVTASLEAPLISLNICDTVQLNGKAAANRSLAVTLPPGYIYKPGRNPDVFSNPVNA